jgi:hypothetical protein
MNSTFKFLARALLLTRSLEKIFSRALTLSVSASLCVIVRVCSAKIPTSKSRRLPLVRVTIPP